ncbi:hypothetical protein L3Q82_016951 [Scortum barcoo]|uniref:Uncharacterized protein n=1 Tax=Scortum barcoo TaxID=214431 RepID=A0ACB8X857_9TELE|nr:hypothetical protein L3Q82_016951 [Scortum barcoo]
MAAESTISPEHNSLPSAQCRRRRGEEVQKYQSMRKRSSKDWYPPDLAYVRSRLHMRRMTMDQNAQWVGHRDILDTCQELGGYSTWGACFLQQFSTGACAQGHLSRERGLASPGTATVQACRRIARRLPLPVLPLSETTQQRKSSCPQWPRSTPVLCSALAEEEAAWRVGSLQGVHAHLWPMHTLVICLSLACEEQEAWELKFQHLVLRCGPLATRRDHLGRGLVGRTSFVDNVCEREKETEEERRNDRQLGPAVSCHSVPITTSLMSKPRSLGCFKRLHASDFVSADMAAAAVISNQNVVARVSSLPLVSSTYGLVSSVYSNTKDNHPYIRTVCEAAEQGVRNITSVVLTTASPIIDKLEPQIAIANDLACKGLDKIEKTLPILHQPSEQIVSSAKDVVTTAKDVMTGTVSGAKDTVSDTLTSAVEKTRGVVHDGMEKTRAVVVGSVSTVMESRVARLVSTGVDTALSTSESLVDQYLPLTEDELAELEAKAVQCFDKKEPSYYVRLGSLSTKLRKRAYTRAVAKIQDGKQRSKEFISELNSTVDLIEYGRKNIDGANQKVNEKLSSLVSWKSSGPNQEDGHEAEVIESRTLALARSLTHQLQTTCLVLVSSLQGLPNHIQQEVLSLSRSATQIYTNFSKASRLGELPDSVLTSSKVQLGKMKDSLDHVMDYLVNNTPLNWLVGPFYPRMAPEPTRTPASPASSTQATSSSSPSTQPEREEPTEVEMQSLQSKQQQ